MDDKPEPQVWYYREGGVVTQSGTSPGNEAIFARSAAYRRIAECKAAAPGDYEALASGKGLPLSQAITGNLMSEEAMGWLFHEAGAELAELDALVRRIGERIGPPMGELLAWQLVEEYVGRALGSVQEEYGLFAEDPAARLADLGSIAPEDADAMRDRWAREDAARDAYEQSAEGIAEAARRAEQMQPDGGPEGWSTVPPLNADGTPNTDHPVAKAHNTHG